LYLNPEILVLNGQVTAQYSPNNPGNGGESSGNTPPAGTNTKTEISGNTVTVTTTIAADDGTGKATASVSQTQVKDMIGKAAEEAKKQGNTTAVIVEIKIEAAADTKTVQTALPKPAVNALAADSNIDALRVSTQIAAITFDRKALDTIAGATTDDVKISATKIDTSTLTDETKLKVGDGPSLIFSVTSGNRTISEFGGTYRYRFHIHQKQARIPTRLSFTNINAEGIPEAVPTANISRNKTVSFTTNHFSKYAVGYNKVCFTDVKAGAWYEDAVDFAAARGIVTGTGNGNYNPDGKLTRARSWSC